MRDVLRLARKGLGHTFPNPMVGAVIVKNHQIIGAGYHHKAGKPHAEIVALDAIKSSARGATLYVNLEPCSHHGKTPPCVEAIIAAGVSRVVCCTRDPNPIVHGEGIARLQKAGIIVTVGLLSSEAKILNEAFFGFHEHQRPFTAIKFAASLDGKIATATHDSKWITGEKARGFSHRLRGQYQAIMVGVNTVLEDDPHLGTHSSRSDPLRIVLDSTLRLPLTSQVLRDNNVWVVTTKRADTAKRHALQQRGISLLTMPGSHISVPQLLKELGKRNIISLLVEGGGTLLGSFSDSQAVDKVYAFYGPVIIGGTQAISAIGGQGASQLAQALHLQSLRFRRFDESFMITGYVTKEEAKQTQSGER